MSSYFILVHTSLVKLDQHVTESHNAFIKRVEFLVYALSLGHSMAISQTLSYAYQNKLQHSMSYPVGVEQQLTAIITAMNDYIPNITMIDLPE